MKNELVRGDGELSIESARTTRCQLELGIIDNDALLFRKLARAFHDHTFSCRARDFEPNIPILGSMHDEQQSPIRLNLLIQFDIRSFELKAEVTAENTNRLTRDINMAHHHCWNRFRGVEGWWTMMVIDRGPG